MIACVIAGRAHCAGQRHVRLKTSAVRARSAPHEGQRARLAASAKPDGTVSGAIHAIRASRKHPMRSSVRPNGLVVAAARSPMSSTSAICCDRHFTEERQRANAEFSAGGAGRPSRARLARLFRQRSTRRRRRERAAKNSRSDDRWAHGTLRWARRAGMSVQSGKGAAPFWTEARPNRRTGSKRQPLATDSPAFLLVEELLVFGRMARAPSSTTGRPARSGSRHRSSRCRLRADAAPR